MLRGGPGLAGRYTTADASLDLAGGNTEAEGEGIAGTLDLNGDGAADLFTSAWDGSRGLGGAWLIYGAPSR